MNVKKGDTVLVIAGKDKGKKGKVLETSPKSQKVVVENVKKLPTTQGYDALNNEYVDMFEAGIVDPAKVTRSALENAISVASMLLTTEAAVVDIPKKESAMPDMSAMGGMGGMGGMM